MSLNLTPFIKLKSNTKRNAEGSWSWREMVTMYQDNREEFDKHYHQCSIVEAVYAAIKAMYGDSLRTRLLKIQTVETMAFGKTETEAGDNLVNAITKNVNEWPEQIPDILGAPSREVNIKE